MMKRISRAALIAFALAAWVPAVAAGEAPAKTTRQQVFENSMTQEWLGTWETDAGLEKLVRLPTAAGNAAEHYARLEALYPEDRESENRYDVRKDAKGISEIFAAARIRQCRMTPEFYPHMETGTSNQPDILIFQAYAKAILKRAGDLEEQGDLRGANQTYQDCLIWGWHFTSERPNLVTYMIGLTIKLRAARAYERFLQRALAMDRSRAAREYGDRLVQTIGRVSAKSRIYLGDFKDFNCLYSSIKVARDDQEPFWRQEAVLRLGVLRHGAPDPDLKAIVKNEALQRLAFDTLIHIAENDSKPWIRSLAQWSIQNVTPERFQDMRRRTMFPSLEEDADADARAPGKRATSQDIEKEAQSQLP